MLQFNYVSAQSISVKFWTKADETIQVGTLGGYSATASPTLINLYKVNPPLLQVPIGDYYVTIELSGGQAGFFAARRSDLDNWIVGSSFEALDKANVLLFGGSVSILPFSYDTEERVKNKSINVLYMEKIPVTVFINDASGALDLTHKTLKFVIESPSKVDIATILDANVRRSATSFTVDITTVVSSAIGTYWWSLRDITSDEIVLAHGKLDVTYVARAE